jgi:glycosyltransferase involved in cell wall biosynthesis
MARISMLCPDLERGPLYTAWMFSGALGRRHHVELVGPRPRRLWPPAEGEIEPSHVLPGRSPLRRAVRREALEATAGADLLYAFKTHPASLGVGLWLGRRSATPLAVHLDDWDGGYFSEVSTPRRLWYAARNITKPDNELYFWGLERMLGRADAITVSTRALQRRFGGAVVRQGVDHVRFSPDRFPRDEARSRVGIPEDVPVVSFIGTPTLHKGLAELIDAFRALPADLRGKLVIVGTPADDATARVLEESEGVECRPYVPFGEVAWHVAAADVMCAPQRPTVYAQHQLPAKILHWMSLGACTLTTDVGDADELLGGSPPAGVVVPALDKAALRDSLTRLLEDAGLRRSLGNAARERAERLYSWDAMSDALNDAFKELRLDA